MPSMRGPSFRGSGDNALTRGVYFIAVRLVPCELVLGMAAELAIFKCLASVEFHDSQIPVVKECG